MMNWGELTASPRVISVAGCVFTAADLSSASGTGGRRTKNDVGIMITAARAAMISSAVRQSWWPMSQAAMGDIVIGAMPIPADTSDTARLLWVSNQPVTVAIMGAKIAAAAVPTSSPNRSWNSSSERLKLASARLTASRTEPVTTTVWGPMRSVTVPQNTLPNAMARKPMVMATDMPV